MHAEWALALGQDAPALAIPWKDESGRVAYVDLRARPDALLDIPEARENPSLALALELLNAKESPWLTAKCDVWPLDEEDTQTLALDLNVEDAHAGRGSYIDIVHCDAKSFASLDVQRALLEDLTRAVEALPYTHASAELVLRHCVCEEREGYATSVFVYGLGSDAATAQANWSAALTAVASVLAEHP